MFELRLIDLSSNQTKKHVLELKMASKQLKIR